MGALVVEVQGVADVPTEKFVAVEIREWSRHGGDQQGGRSLEFNTALSRGCTLITRGLNADFFVATAKCRKIMARKSS